MPRIATARASAMPVGALQARASRIRVPLDESQPLPLHVTTVLPEWIDYNGHITESRYLEVFGNATDALLEYIGAGPSYVGQGHSFFTVETHIRHLEEAGDGESLSVTTQLRWQWLAITGSTSFNASWRM
jgi:hypothetical protein